MRRQADTVAKLAQNDINKVVYFLLRKVAKSFFFFPCFVTCYRVLPTFRVYRECFRLFRDVRDCCTFPKAITAVFSCGASKLIDSGYNPGYRQVHKKFWENPLFLNVFAKFGKSVHMPGRNRYMFFFVWSFTNIIDNTQISPSFRAFFAFVCMLCMVLE